MSTFPFIPDNVLRTNLDSTFDHIVDLLALSESNSYEGKVLLVNSLRKTIVIHTAAIIEALLLWKLKRLIDNEKVELSNEWQYVDIRVIYKLNESEEIIAGRRKKEIKKVNQLDFVRIIGLCEKYDVIDENFAKKAHKVRKLRNRLHIGGLTAMEKDYKKSDLNFVFDVAKDTKEFVSKQA